MLDSKPGILAFLLVLALGLGCMLTESQTGQYDRLLPMTAVYLLPAFLLFRAVVNRKNWRGSKTAFFRETAREAFLLSLLSLLFIPTVNRLLPPSTDCLIDGQVLDVKPGKGGLSWGLAIRQGNGDIIKITVPSSRYPGVHAGSHVKLRVKRGGLGLLYGERRG